MVRFTFEFVQPAHNIGPVTVDVEVERAEGYGLALYDLGIVADVSVDRAG